MKCNRNKAHNIDFNHYLVYGLVNLCFRRENSFIPKFCITFDASKMIRIIQQKKRWFLKTFFVIGGAKFKSHLKRVSVIETRPFHRLNGILNSRLTC